jgi:hypothetical protein
VLAPFRHLISPLICPEVHVCRIFRIYIHTGFLRLITVRYTDPTFGFSGVHVCRIFRIYIHTGFLRLITVRYITLSLRLTHLFYFLHVMHRYPFNYVTRKRSGLKYVENSTILLTKIHFTYNVRKHVDNHLLKTRILLILQTFFAQILFSEIFFLIFILFIYF